MASSSKSNKNTTSASSNESKQDEKDPEVLRFSPEEEATLLGESNERKREANTLFASKKYQDALAKYDEAVSSCPTYLDYELAVLQSNIAACHLKLEEWKEAISSATVSLDSLGRLEKADADALEKEKKEAASEEEIEDEIVSSGAAKSAPAPLVDDSRVAARKKRREDVERIKAKALMRRGRARSEAGGWQNLAGAEEDYKRLATMGNLNPADKRTVQSQLRTLPPRTKAAQEQEMAEMWGKLKQLGNGILKPFGLSTENFQMAKDENTGGYSMNFKPGDSST